MTTTVSSETNKPRSAQPPTDRRGVYWENSNMDQTSQMECSSQEDDVTCPLPSIRRAFFAKRQALREGGSFF